MSTAPEYVLIPTSPRKRFSLRRVRARLASVVAPTGPDETENLDRTLVIDLTGPEAERAIELSERDKNIKAAMRPLEAERAEIRAEVIAMAGENATMVLANGRKVARHSFVTRRSVNPDDLRRADPTVYRRLVKVTEGRRFEIV